MKPGLGKPTREGNPGETWPLPLPASAKPYQIDSAYNATSMYNKRPEDNWGDEMDKVPSDNSRVFRFFWNSDPLLYIVCRCTIDDVTPAPAVNVSIA